MSTADQLYPSKRTVVVSGLGVISPIGVGTEEFWRAVLAGKVGTDQVTQFETSEFLTHRAGEVKLFEPARYIRNQSYQKLSRTAQFAVAVTRMALEDAHLMGPGYESDRIGVCFGTVLGSRPSVEPAVRALWARRDAPLDGPVSGPSYDPTLLSRAPAKEFDLRGPNLVIPTACAAGNSAIGYGVDAIQGGRAEVMICGGADELSVAMYMMFNRFNALAPDAVRPFDRNRKGLILAEGAGGLVLESLEHARSRGAPVYCTVSGHGNFTDAYHITAPHPEGLGAVRSMEAALNMSGFSADEVDYISAHGTGTPINDLIEAKAIRALWGRTADVVPVSSIKSMMGHTQGAASAIEAVSCVLAIRDGVIPPNVNYEEPDPECALNIVANVAQRRRVDVALSNAFGFGGNISCVVFSRTEN